MDAHKGYYRFVVLAFNCMLTFGSYYCFDMPSVLDVQLQKPRSEGGVGLSGTQYNLLYAIYAWTNAAMVLIAGYIVDRWGNKPGLYLYSFLCVLGSVIFAVGATMNQFPVMLVGRLVFGSGNGSLTIVQNRVSAFWFKGKELALAFGFTLAFSRLGSVLNFLVTDTYAESLWPNNPHLQVVNTLWSGALLCGLGFVSAAILAYLDERGMAQLGRSRQIDSNARRVNPKDVLSFSKAFWLVNISIMFFYNGVFPFVAIASLFIHDKYGMEKNLASKLAGTVYYISIVLSPLMGFVVDRIGRRGLLALLFATLSLPVFGLLAFTCVYPVIPLAWFGVIYSVEAATLWPSIPLVVQLSNVGLAMGVVTSVQMIGIGICNIVVGKLEDINKPSAPLPFSHQKGSCAGNSTMSVSGSKDIVPDANWKYIMIFLFAQTICCVVTTIFLNINDARTGSTLNKKRMKRTPMKDEGENSNVNGDEAEGPLDSETEGLLPPPTFEGDRKRTYSVN